MPTFRIPDCNLPRLQKELDRLIKRASKLDVSPITVTIGEPFDVPLVTQPSNQPPQYWFNTERQPDPDRIIGYRKYYAVTVDGQAPKLNGWTLAATLQSVVLEDDTIVGILRTAGDQVIPPEYRDKWAQCDHCKTERYRKDVYVVKHEDGRLRVVGSSCLKDFLGHNSPESAARYAEYLCEIGDLCDGAQDAEFWGFGGEGRVSAYSVAHTLEVATAIIRKDGFMSRSKAIEMYKDELATVNTVQYYLATSPRKEPEEYRRLREQYPIGPEEEQIAADARNWAREQANSDKEYLYTLSVIARSASVEWRNLGYATALIASYQKQMGLNAENSKSFKDSIHIGQVDSRVRITVELLKAHRIDTGSRFGHKTVMTYRTVNTLDATDGRLQHPEGCRITWFASGDPNDDLCNKGEVYKLVATITEHGEYKDKPQTLVKRVALYAPKKKEPKVKKPRKKKVPQPEPVYLEETDITFSFTF